MRESIRNIPLAQKAKPLQGSYRSYARIPGASLIGSLNRNDRMEIILTVRRKTVHEGQSPNDLRGHIDDINGRIPTERRYLSHEKLERLYGASPDDFNQINTFARKHSLEVVDASLPKRTVVLRGTVDCLCSLFGVGLKCYNYRGNLYRGRKGWIHVPNEIFHIVRGVHGFDNRPHVGKDFQPFQKKTTGIGRISLP